MNSRLLDSINSRKIGKVEWIILFALLLFPLLTECFYDFLATYTHGYALLRATFQGHFFQFHEYAKTFTMENGYDATVKDMWGAAYPLPIYIFFAIWSIPVAILRKIFEIGLYDVGVILWYKLLICIVLAGSVWKLGSIMKRVGANETVITMTCFIFSSSLFLVMPTFFMSGYDIFCTFFMLWGIDEYIKNDKSLKWIGILGIALTFKALAVFVFVPMLLLKEKRILAIIWKGILAILPLMVCSMLFAFEESFQDISSSFLPSFVNKVLYNTLPGGNSPIPIFIAGWVALCIWAYMQNVENEPKIVATNVAWSGLVSYGLLTTFVYCHPQWVVVFVPFLALVLGLNEERIKINVILEFVGTAALSFFYLLHFAWVFCYRGSLGFVALRGLGIQKNSDISFARYFHDIFTFTFDPLIFAVFAVAILGLAVLNYPGRKTNEKPTDYLSHLDYGMIVLRLLLIPLLFVTDLLINFA